MAQHDPVRSKASRASGGDKTRSVAERHIIVGLDSGFMAREALMLAARLAASVDAGLKGIFVEDENLLNLSSLPFASEMTQAGVTSRIDEREMLRALEAQAQIARRVLERVAREAHVVSVFDIVRGHRLASLAARAAATDTLIIRAHEASHHDVGRAVRAATRDVRADVLLAGRGVAVRTSLAASPMLLSASTSRRAGFSAAPERPVLAIDEGSTLGEACVTFAEALAQRVGTPFRRLYARGFGSADIAAAARRMSAALIVVNADALGDDDDAARLSAAAGCPVLLLGGERNRFSPRAPDARTG